MTARFDTVPPGTPPPSGPPPGPTGPTPSGPGRAEARGTEHGAPRPPAGPGNPAPAPSGPGRHHLSTLAGLPIPGRTASTPARPAGHAPIPTSPGMGAPVQWGAGATGRATVPPPVDGRPAGPAPTADEWRRSAAREVGTGVEGRPAPASRAPSLVYAAAQNLVLAGMFLAAFGAGWS